MICTNCFEADCAPAETTIVDHGFTLSVECDKCPKCGEITFTHEQSLEVDRKRRDALYEKRRMDMVLWLG